MMKCLKCQKEYNPKRVDGMFCKTSCGNAYRQQQKRNTQKKGKLVELGQAVKKPLTEEEAQLRSLLFGLVEEAKKLLAEKELPADKRPADWDERIGAILMNCQATGENELVKGLAVRFEAQQKAEEQVMIANRTRFMSEQEKQTWVELGDDGMRLNYEDIIRTNYKSKQ